MDSGASVILGTAGHIDHGKTSLVRALTGVDTDRLKEEKARGITIELGFAELVEEGRPHFGVVDVPGHEAFVRAMVAGAAGMDVLLLVVAADESVMPQTREHLAIAGLLDVPEVVVALTKVDLVEPEWLELVEAEVAELLEGTPYAGAPCIATSSESGTGLDALLDALTEAAHRVRGKARDDLMRLPLDRVFTIQGTGTVVTGTLWSGTVQSGERVRVLPDELQARVRGVQVHARTVTEAHAGDRVALALTGDGADRDLLDRGATLVSAPAWEASRMLTAEVRLLPDTGWSLEHNQRVHVHLGTAEVRARCALLDAEEIGPGGRGWVQLRLEEPLVARARDRLVIRAYSPVTTIGGGVVAESQPPKRHRLDEATRVRLGDLVTGPVAEALAAHVTLSGWAGAHREALPIHLGVSPTEAEAALGVDESLLVTASRAFAGAVTEQAEAAVLGAVERGHREDSLRASIPLASVRGALPQWAADDLADAVIERLVARGALERADGGVRTPGHEASLSEEQGRAYDELAAIFGDAGLAPPPVEELPEALRGRADLWPLLRRLESAGTIRPIADGLYVSAAELDQAAARVQDRLGGRKGLGPADFRDVLPVTRKHLIPLLNYFDGQGTTLRDADGRTVPRRD